METQVDKEKQEKKRLGDGSEKTFPEAGYDENDDDDDLQTSAYMRHKGNIQ